MNPRILLADDNKDLLMITQIILKGQGYETFLATSVEEAKRKIKIHQPQLLLLDVCIGDDDGRAFCSLLKQTPATCSLNVILMSGDDCIENRISGCDDFLSKPFDYNELVTKVEQQMMVPFVTS